MILLLQQELSQYISIVPKYNCIQLVNAYPSPIFYTYNMYYKIIIAYYKKDTLLYLINHYGLY